MGILKAIGKGIKKVAKVVTAPVRTLAKVVTNTAPAALVGKAVVNKQKQAAAAEVLNQQRKVEDEARLDARQVETEKRFAAQREADLAQGRARGEALFGNNALGRVEAARSADIANILNQRQANMARSGDIAEILAQRKAQLQGFTPEEQQAMREQNMGSIIQGQQAGSRDLARQQARSGVRGALGAAQQSAFQQATQQQLADQERQLFLSNIAEKRGALDRLEGSTRTQEQFEREGLGLLEGSTRATEQDELGRQQFNLGQLGKEKAGMLTTEFGYGGLGAQERAAALQQILGEKGVAGSERIAAATKGKK